MKENIIFKLPTCLDMRLAKMLLQYYLIFNCKRNGWQIQQLGPNKWLVKDELKNRPNVYEPNFLENFMKDNI